LLHFEQLCVGGFDGLCLGDGLESGLEVFVIVPVVGVESMESSELGWGEWERGGCVKGVSGDGGHVESKRKRGREEERKRGWKNE